MRSRESRSIGGAIVASRLGSLSGAIGRLASPAVAITAAVSSVLISRVAAAASDQYFGGSPGSVALNANAYGNSSAGPFTSAFVSGNVIVFGATSSGTGASVTIGGIRAYDNFSLAAGGTLGTGGSVVSVDVASGKVLTFATSQAFSSTTGTGFIKTGDGTWVTSGDTYNGGFTLSAGTLVASGINAMGASSLTINSGTIAATKTLDFSSKYGSGINVGGDFTFGSSASSALGSANLTFSNAVSFGGSTRAITIGGSGTYTLNGAISNGSLTVNGSGGGVLVLGSVGNAFTDATNLNGGIVSFAASGNLGTTDVNFGGGTLQYASGNTYDVSVRTITINAGGATIDVGSNNVTFANPIGNNGLGGLTKAGSGTLTLAAANSYQGTTTLNAGVLAFSSPTNLGSGAITFTGGTLRYAGVNSYDISTRTVSINTAGGTIDTNGNDVTLTNGIGNSGTGLLTKAGNGTLLLLGANSNSGGTKVLGGTIQIGNGGTSGALGAGTVTLSTGTNLVISRSDSVTIPNVISGNGGTLVKNGQNTVTLSGSNAFSGTTIINGGTLNLLGDMINSPVQMNGAAFVAPAGHGIIQVASVTFSKTNSITNSGASSVSVGLLSRGSGTVNLNNIGAAISTSSPTPNGMIGGWITLNRTDWATVIGSNIAAASYSTTSSGSSSNFSVTNNNSLDTGGVVNSLRFNTAGSFSPQPATAGNEIIGSGGILVTANVGSNTSSFGATGTSRTFTSGNGTDIIVHQYNSNGPLVFNAGLTDNSGTSIGLTKVGPGQLTMVGNSTYSGTTRVFEGSLYANAAKSTGSSTGSGVIDVSSGATLSGSGYIGNGSNAITINNGATISAGADGGSVGHLTTGTQAWKGGSGTTGGTYNVKFANSAQPAGTGFDTLTMSLLDLSDLSGGNPFNLKLTKTSTGTFTFALPQKFQIADATSVSLPGAMSLPTAGHPLNISSLFALDTSGIGTSAANFMVSLSFDSSVSGGAYDVAIESTPEPTAALLFGGGAVALLAKRRRGVC